MKFVLETNINQRKEYVRKINKEGILYLNEDGWITLNQFNLNNVLNNFILISNLKIEFPELIEEEIYSMYHSNLFEFRMGFYNDINKTDFYNILKINPYEDD